jgi:alkanesulfonate monooxygenase SsuD/methylene tetrahydromethanopterin reductase-like flavin-dependent oxidoreductase (luciferase family)
MATLSIGAIGGPMLLKGELQQRRNRLEALFKAGVDHLFIADHVSFHNGLGMDGMVNAATLAAMHPTMKIVIGVYLLALRHPVTVARQLSTLSLSAPGRIILGVGVGGEDRHEMEVCGVNPATRGLQTNHCLAALSDLISGQPSSYDCEFFSYDAAIIKPPPKPRIPILIGGRSTAAIRRAARYGDGWLSVWCSPERFLAATGQVMQEAESLGRELDWQHGLQVWVGLGRDADRARACLAEEMEDMYRTPFAAFEKYSPYGSAEAVAEFLLPYVKKGARVLNIKACSVDEDEGIELLGKVCGYLNSAQ